MFDRILLAVDGSEESKKAAVLAGDLAAGRAGTDVLVVHVLEFGAGRGMAFAREVPSEAYDLVDEVVRGLKDAGIGARGEVKEAVHGNAARQLVSAADGFDADLVVMGSRGLSDWQGLILGSVAHQVLHMSHRPVLIAR